MGLPASVCAQIEVVAGKNSDTSALSREQVADIYLGRASRFPNGDRAIPIDLPSRSELRENFYLKVTGKTPAQLKAYWSRMQFTGKGKPPREVSNTDELIRLLIENPAMLGYLNQTDGDGKLKVLYSVTQ